ncbi:MAG: class IV adenylate cyclase [Gammaproteobacteria bacterium]|nr:class IV adenylate cyclase [Gammaproteobacteria bacterium]
MAANVEIKARVSDVAQFVKLASDVADGPAQQLEQYDRFYPVPSGRLKLRQFGDGTSELIFYQRTDTEGAKVSTYSRVSVIDADATHELLTSALGSSKIVKKRRRVWLVGRTRVHLDEVEGLGDFMELEVVLQKGEPPEVGFSEANDLRQKLDVGESELVAGAYVDLLADV